jgi:hypothetical protein
LVVIPGVGRRREFTADQAEQARVLKTLHKKGATLAQLVARADLSLAGPAYVVYDGHELCTCRDANSAIAAVVRATRLCAAVELNAIRTGVAE